MSGAVNLRELVFKYCQNLVKVHDSLGFLDKLELLSFYGCTNLSFLPSFVKLTSLRKLFLNCCRSLRSFPNIIEPMEHLIFLDFDRCGIEEFPFSCSNLTRLESLVLGDCNLHLTTLDNDVEQERVAPSMSSSIIDVQFIACNLPNQLVASFTHFLPNLRFLSLWRSIFTILPACISECHFLRSLVLDDCSSLQEN